jgi:hypothetical protein
VLLPSHSASAGIGEKDYMDIEMLGQLLPEQANAPDSATTYGFAGPVTGTLPPLLSHQLIPNLGHAIKGPLKK